MSPLPSVIVCSCSIDWWDWASSIDTRPRRRIDGRDEEKDSLTETDMYALFLFLFFKLQAVLLGSLTQHNSILWILVAVDRYIFATRRLLYLRLTSSKVMPLNRYVIVITGGQSKQMETNGAEKPTRRKSKWMWFIIAGRRRLRGRREKRTLAIYGEEKGRNKKKNARTDHWKRIKYYGVGWRRGSRNRRCEGGITWFRHGLCMCVCLRGTWKRPNK